MISSVFSISPGTTEYPTVRAPSRSATPLRDYVGDVENALVRVAVDAFGRQPLRYNPLFFYGPTQTGKSHLARILASRWQGAARDGASRDGGTRDGSARDINVRDGSAKDGSANSAAGTSTIAAPVTSRTAARAALANRVTLITGGEFTRALAHAIDTDSLAELHRRFRDTDCFILDGLDQIVNRAAAQQELLAMVDHLVKRDAQIVITGRSAPFEMADLSAALASRLSAGLVVPLRPPGPAARHALVMELARRQRSSLARDRAQSLADRLVRESTDQPTVPELVELVAKFSAALDESGEEAGPTVAAVATVANQLVAERETQRSVPLREISAAVAQYFGLKPSDLKSPSRRQLIVRARGVAIYLGRQLTDASLDRLGEHFGGRDHTTALHACRKTEELLAEDPALQQAVDQLTRQLRSDRGKPV